eukprot:354799-Pelagomonas_calceolata.AAC.2
MPSSITHPGALLRNRRLRQHKVSTVAMPAAAAAELLLIRVQVLRVRAQPSSRRGRQGPSSLLAGSSSGTTTAQALLALRCRHGSGGGLPLLLLLLLLLLVSVIVVVMMVVIFLEVRGDQAVAALAREGRDRA